MLLSIFATDSRAVLAEELSGELLTSGNPETRDTYISQSPTTKPVPICPSETKFVLTQLAGTVVKLYGSHQGNPNKSKVNERNCFRVDQFKVEEISPGRKAFVGKLSEESKNKFVITSADNEKWTLAQIAPGVEDLKNTTVIADLVASSNIQGETTWVVARIFGFPTP